MNSYDIDVQVPDRFSCTMFLYTFHFRFDGFDNLFNVFICDIGDTEIFLLSFVSSLMAAFKNSFE